MSSTADSEQPADDTKGPTGVTTRQLARILHKNGFPQKNNASGRISGTWRQLSDPEFSDLEEDGRFLWLTASTVSTYVGLPLAIFGGVWFFGLAIWIECCKRGWAKSELELSEAGFFEQSKDFGDWLAGQGAVPTSDMLLSLIALGITAIGLVAVLVGIYEKKIDEKAEKVGRRVDRFVANMTISKEESSDETHWRVGLPPENVEVPAVQQVFGRDRVTVMSGLVGNAYRWFLYLVCALLPLTINASLRTPDDAGWLADVVGVIVVGMVAVVFEQFQVGVNLRRSVDLAQAVLARWSLVRKSLGIASRNGGGTPEKKPRYCCPVRLLLDFITAPFRTPRRVVVYGLLVVVLAVVCFRNFGLLSFGSWLSCVIGFTFNLAFTFMLWRLLRARAYRVAIRKANTCTLAAANYSAHNGWVWVGIVSCSLFLWGGVWTLFGSGPRALGIICLFLASCYLLTATIGHLCEKLKGPLSSKWSFCLKFISKRDFVESEIERRIEESLEELAERYKSVNPAPHSTEDSEDSHSTNWSENDQTTDGAKKQTVNSGREFIVYKGDTVREN